MEELQTCPGITTKFEFCKKSALKGSICCKNHKNFDNLFNDEYFPKERRWVTKNFYDEEIDLNERMRYFLNKRIEAFDDIDDKNVKKCIEKIKGIIKMLDEDLEIMRFDQNWEVEIAKMVNTLSTFFKKKVDSEDLKKKFKPYLKQVKVQLILFINDCQEEESEVEKQSEVEESEEQSEIEESEEESEEQSEEESEEQSEKMEELIKKE